MLTLAQQGAAVSAGRTASTWKSLTSRWFDELFSARASGHRAQRLTHHAQPGKEFMVRKTRPTRTLRKSPDLDQLRRQAKELLAAFVAGEAEAIAEVNAHYHDVDAAAFALHDAQLVLARSYGFDSWPKLKAYVDGVSVQRLVEAVRAGDLTQVGAVLTARPELVNMEMAENDEHRALHFAVFARAPEMVRLLMEHGADARRGIYPHRDATSPLTLATERGYTDIVAVIEEQEQRRRETRSGPNAPVTAVQDELSEAIARGDETRALAILEREPALIHACDRRGWTPLHMAAAALNQRLVTWLLDHGADVNRRGPEDRTPLDLADGTGWRKAGGLEKYPAVAGQLRARGAGLTARSAVALSEADWLRAHHGQGTLVNRIDGPGGLLSVAVRHDRPEMLKLLLDLGFDPDERTRLADLEEVVSSWGMPLHHCAGLGKHAMAEMLLERGADPNGQVYASGSVMYSALAAGDEAMVKLLERHSGFADAATVGHLRLTDQARQMLADEAAGRLREGAFLNVNGTLAQELLWAGLRGGDPEIVRMALERVDWPRDHPDWFGKLWSPLPGYRPRSAADHALYLECFRLVLERCDPNVRHPRIGRTVLHDVAASDEAVSPEEAVAFATLLLDAGARVDERDDLLRSTPLGWACRWGRLELVKLLIERGSDAAEADAEPWATPRAWAEKMRRDDVLTVLGSV
jgi:ankyrin repeat protein